MKQVSRICVFPNFLGKQNFNIFVCFLKYIEQPCQNILPKNIGQHLGKLMFFRYCSPEDLDKYIYI